MFLQEVEQPPAPAAPGLGPGPALDGDVDAVFPALFADLAGPVYTVGLRLCGRQEAEDVAQEAFVRAYRALRDYPADRRRSIRLRPWVLTIALNVARNRLRAAARDVALDGAALHAAEREERPATAPPEVAAERAELRTRLARALGRLPAPAREAVVLRHVVGCPVAEVAEILGRPAGTVKAQVWRGLAALREDLEAEDRMWRDE